MLSCCNNVQKVLATLLISEDLDEVKAMSDRIMVMFNGEVMGTVKSEDVTIEQLGLMMAGETAEQVLGSVRRK